jgi:hypothetical protein
MIKKKTWLVLILIFITGFYLRNSQYWNGYHTDGFVAQEAAHYWLVHGVYVKGCAIGNIYECKLYQQVLAPPGFPLLIVLYSLVFGFNSLNASVLSAVLSSLTIVLTFLIAYLLFKKEEVALFSSLIFAFIPLNILNSQTGLSRPAGLFFAGLTVLSYLIALKNNKLKTWILTVLSFSYSIYVRQENYLLVIPLTLGIFMFKPVKTEKLFEYLKRHRTQILLLFGMFVILQLDFLNWFLFHNPFNTYSSPYNIKYFIVKAPLTIALLFNKSIFNIDFLPKGIYYNTIVSTLFLVSILFLFIKKMKKSILFLFTWFAVYFVFFSFFFDQGIVIKGFKLVNITTDYIRRTLMFHIPYSIMGSSVIWWITNSFRGIPKKAILLVFILIIILPARNLAHPVLFQDIRTSSPEGDYFLAVNKTPNECLIITTKHMIVTNDYFKDNLRKAIDIELINENTLSLILSYLRQQECVLSFKDYRCSDRTGDYQCKFINKYLNQTYLFTHGGIEVYNLTLKK